MEAMLFTVMVGKQSGEIIERINSDDLREAFHILDDYEEKYRYQGRGTVASIIDNMTGRKEYFLNIN